VRSYSGTFCGETATAELTFEIQFFQLQSNGAWSLLREAQHLRFWQTGFLTRTRGMVLPDI
jgi:hypothetical protein